MSVAEQRWTPQELESRVQKIVAVIDDWGDLRVEDRGARTPHRALTMTLDCPGSGLPSDVRTIYREWYARDGDEWVLTKCSYDYLDHVHDVRLAYHWHDLGGVPTPHAHCERLVPGQEHASERDHLRATPIALLEAHDEFMRLYAAGVAPDCDTFRPLALAR